MSDNSLSPAISGLYVLLSDRQLDMSFYLTLFIFIYLFKSSNFIIYANDV